VAGDSIIRSKIHCYRHWYGIGYSNVLLSHYIAWQLIIRSLYPFYRHCRGHAPKACVLDRLPNNHVQGFLSDKASSSKHDIIILGMR
jgi:hypothetical protein